MATLPNPFRYGALALDEAFTDREREVAELMSDVLNGQDVVILAPRRYGKSSLVWRVQQELVKKRVLVAHVDLMTAPTKEKLAEKLAKTIHEDIASAVYRARHRALEVFRGLRITPTITIDPDSAAVSFAFEAGRAREDLDATLERLLALPGELAAERKRTVALVLDEFQEVVDIDPQLPKLMRAVFQTQPEVAHLYLGSRRHMMRQIFSDENEPFWRSAKQMELGVIPPALFAPFITERFGVTGRRIDDAAVALILSITRGHPYGTQELCYFTWEATPARRRANVDTVGLGLSAVLRSEHAHFTLLWDGLSAGQRVLLEALALDPGRPYSADYRRRLRLPAATNVQKAVSALVARELIEKREDGAYVISEPFLAEWIARVITPGATGEL
jgi:AAA+ ATPase superfamily predicted ATPase